MSIIGTRPPLISETNFYELHHRARLAIKPGITGMWQVSGRSDITDFEEVVRLDKEYGTPSPFVLDRFLDSYNYKLTEVKDFIAAQQSEDKRIKIDLVPADEERRASRIVIFD